MLFIVYLSFRVIEWTLFDDGNRTEIAKKILADMAAEPGINCLILGGSNSVFGISAKQISEVLNFKCYNLSMLNQGYSSSAYWSFVEDALDGNEKQIKYVIYSSIMPYRDIKYFNEKQIAEKNKVDNANLSEGDKFPLFSINSFIFSNFFLFPSSEYNL